MKKVCLLTAILALAIYNLSIAQKLDKETIGYYKYTQPPINTVIVPFNTYLVIGKGMNGDAYRRDIIVAKTYLNGFEKLEEGSDADLKVEVEEYPVSYGESKRSESVEKYKVDGVEKTRKWYTFSCEVRYKYVMKIFAKSGEKLYEKELGGTDNVSGDKKTSSSDAFNSFKAKKDKFHQEITANMVSGLCRTVNDQIGFPVQSIYLRTGNVKAKKFNYDDFFKAWELLKSGYEAVKEDEENIEAASASLNEAIGIWEKILEESDVEDKKARVNKDVTMASYANIGICYFMMKDYTKAAEFLTKSNDLDRNFANIRSIKETSESMIKRVAAFNEVTASK